MLSSPEKHSIIDLFVETLPETHIPGYNFCGPNTDLEKRFAQGVQGVDEVDCACLAHDYAYVLSKDIKMRHQADKKLFSTAFSRIHAKDSRIRERFTALVVSGLIDIKIIFNKIEIYFRCSFRKLNKNKV